MSSRRRQPRPDEGLFPHEDSVAGAGAETAHEAAEAVEVPDLAEPVGPAEPVDVAEETDSGEAAAPVEASPESTPVAPVAVPASGGRSASLRVASLHLRMGQHALARAELEAFAGRGRLDEQALLDLAEVRWRSGDLVGATEAAAAVLASGHEALLALVIAAEGFATTGRPTEARRLALRAVELAGDGLEAVFAGMPSGRAWPDGAGSDDAADADEADGAEAASPGDPELTTPTAPNAASEEPEPDAQPEPAEPEPVPAASEPDAQPERTAVPVPEPASAGQLPPGVAVAAVGSQSSPADKAISAAAAAMHDGRIDQASLLFGLGLRLDPATAADVLRHLRAPTSDPRLWLVEGDALQLLGRQAEASEAFARAGSHLLENDGNA